MKIVADTNVLLAVALDEPEKESIINLTVGVTAIAPEILPYEVGNALSAMVKRSKLGHSEAVEAERVIARIPVRLVSVSIYASLQIALAHNIYAYDAYFLQCAQSLACPMLTLDRRMKQVAESIGLKVLE